MNQATKTRLWLECIVLFLCLTWLSFSVPKQVWFLLQESRFIPQTAQQYHLLAKSAVLSNRFGDAERYAKAALTLDPGAYKARNDLGNAYILTGNFIKASLVLEDAIADAQKAHDFANCAIIYVNLGEAYAVERKAQKAWDCFRKAYEMDAQIRNEPRWKGGSTPWNKFVAQNDYQKFKDAVKSYTERPGELTSTLRRIYRSLLQKQYNGAIAECQKYLADNPGTVYAFLFIQPIADAQGKLRRFDETFKMLTVYQSSRLYDTLIPKFDYLRARTLYSEEKYQAAFDYLLRVQNHTLDTTLQEEIEFLLRRIVSGSKGMLHITAWEVSNTPKPFFKAELYFLLAEQYFKDCKYKKAQEAIEKIMGSGFASEIKKLGDYYDVCILASKIYEENGDLLKAKAIIEDFVKKQPAHRMKGQAELRLMELDVKIGEYAGAYKHLLESKLGLSILLGSLTVIALLCAGFMFAFSLLSRIFFKIKLYDVRVCGIFSEIDLFKFLVYLFSFLTLGPMIFLALDYYFRPGFESLHLNPILAGALFADIILVVYTMYLLIGKYRLKHEQLGFISRGFKVNVMLPIAVVFGSLVFLALLGILYEKLGTHVPSSGWKDVMYNTFTKKNNGFETFTVFMGLVIIGPIAEELLFRVFAFNFFERYTNVFWATALSSLLFALCHQYLVMLPYFTALGIILCFLYYKTKSIIPGMVTHALYNFTIFLFVFLFA